MFLKLHYFLSYIHFLFLSFLGKRTPLICFRVIIFWELKPLLLHLTCNRCYVSSWQVGNGCWISAAFASKQTPCRSLIKDFSFMSIVCARIAYNVYYIHSVLTFMLQANSSNNNLSLDYITGSVSVGSSELKLCSLVLHDYVDSVFCFITV